MKFLFDGQEKRLSLGVYPEVSLLEARKKRENLKDQISQGINPIEERKEAKQTKIIEEINQQYTFEFLANEYFEHSKTLENPLSDSHHEKQVGRIKNHCLPHIGKIPR